MKDVKVLVVDDERAIQLALSGLLKREGHHVEVSGSGQGAIALLEEKRFDLVLTDLVLGKGMSGLDVLTASKRLYPESPVIMITAQGSERVAVDAMKAGAEDYVPKPFDNDELRLVVQRALARSQLAREHRLLLERLERQYGFGSLIGAGPAMQRVFETIRRAAETDITVLIRGESGTGKELVAQALHLRSARSERPFVAVNCAAINRELVESELFGHEKGAFTGAGTQRVGRFESAASGTIFLDEIGDMPQDTQAKVLRVLQERTLERVGGNVPIPIDVRVISATHQDLEAEIDAGHFRADLYYRLRVVEIDLPALRERVEDIPALVDRFLGTVAERLARPRPDITPKALARLAEHSWPGNVRELRNVIEQAAVLAAGPVIDVDDLRFDRRRQKPPPAPAAPEPASFAEAKRQAMVAFERRFLLEALRQNDGNITRTAEAIGMVRQSLQQKMKELDLRETDGRRGGET